MAGSPTSTQQPGTDADPLLGRTLNDRYKIVEQIGQGGMGRVYKALQAPLERLVALKVLGAGHDRDPNFYKRFFLEASVTAKLTHPNTITLYDYGRTDDGIFFIAMEYLAGRTLSQTMQSDGPLAQERAIHIAQQICRSLREAHGLGIIHRDMKPANVMLLRQHDDDDFVKVLDFGLVKFFSGDGPEADITNAGTFMGSPHYIAPEQARNQSPDQRCDIYSLGVLLFQMLTGRVPFTAPAPVDIILKHLHDEAPAPRQVRPDLALSAELEQVVLRCLQKRREDRFQTMDELLQALKVVRARITGSRSGLAADTEDAIAKALTARTPSGPQPTPRTPSGPMQSVRTPSGPQRSVPPPPPPDALEDPARHRTPTPRSRPSVAPAPSPLRPIVILPAALAIGGVLGLALHMRSAARSVPADDAVDIASPAPASPQPAPVQVQPQPPAPQPLPAPPAAPTVYPTALSGTTLVLITSAPSGAEVRDADDRLLGITPFEMNAPAARTLQLTLRRDGYRPASVTRTPAGDRMPIAVTLKKDAKTPEPPDRPRRSVGYKDDPY